MNAQDQLKQAEQDLQDAQRRIRDARQQVAAKERADREAAEKRVAEVPLADRVFNVGTDPGIYENANYPFVFIKGVGITSGHNSETVCADTGQAFHWHQNVIAQALNTLKGIPYSVWPQVRELLAREVTNYSGDGMHARLNPDAGKRNLRRVHELANTIMAAAHREGGE